MQILAKGNNVLGDRRGFTLTELMVVVGMAIVLAGFSYSGFSSWNRKERVRTATYRLSAALKEARFRSIELDNRHKVKLIDNATTGTKQITIFDIDNATTPIFVRRFDLGSIDDSSGTTHSEFVFGTRGKLDSPSGNSQYEAGFKNEQGFSCNVVITMLGYTEVKCDDDATYGMN